MLAIAEDIFKEVEAEAEALVLNGEVVRRALQLTESSFHWVRREIEVETIMSRMYKK